jgi:DNA-binding GntR family transcriptional regulator
MIINNRSRSQPFPARHGRVKLDTEMTLTEGLNRRQLNAGPGPIRTISKIEQVRHAVLYQIISGVLKPGQRIVEARLATQLDVSQATVNAALQDMHNQGIVRKVTNRFTEVSRYTSLDIQNLFSLRLIIEPAAAETVARGLSEEGIARLTEHLDLMRSAARVNDVARFSFADYSFHQEIYLLSSNSFLIQACQAIAAAPFAYILCDCSTALPVDYVSLAEDHQVIIDALKAGPDIAARVCLDKIETWRLHSLRALESASQETSLPVVSV